MINSNWYSSIILSHFGSVYGDTATLCSFLTLILYLPLARGSHQGPSAPERKHEWPLPITLRSTEYKLEVTTATTIDSWADK